MNNFGGCCNRLNRSAGYLLPARVGKSGSYYLYSDFPSVWNQAVMVTRRYRKAALPREEKLILITSFQATGTLFLFLPGPGCPFLPFRAEEKIIGIKAIE